MYEKIRTYPGYAIGKHLVHNLNISKYNSWEGYVQENFVYLEYYIKMKKIWILYKSAFWIVCMKLCKNWILHKIYIYCVLHKYKYILLSAQKLSKLTCNTKICVIMEDYTDKCVNILNRYICILGYVYFYAYF